MVRFLYQKNMKKVLLSIVALIACLTLTQQANAHAIWIESNSKGSKNKPQQVKVFYGEYPEGVADPVEKWYSDLKGLQVWVISPSQRKSQLTLTNAKDFLSASFTPDEDGVYYVTTVHATKDLGGTTKYEFSSVAPVLVGSPITAPAAPAQSLALIVAPKPYKVNDQVQLQVWKDGQAFVGGEVLVMSPEGWVKTIKTDDKGQITFSPKLKGNYVIEASDYKKEEGKWNDKDYTHSWKGSTTRILVN